MLDPILRLAVAMQSSKGVYAPLLGSGVSRSAAIPTGWEVILDLIRKLAHAKGESCEPDPEAWYRALTGAEPDYSDILDQLTLTSAERVQLLRSYFEPSDEDRERGRKAPSPAHRAVATLVAKGYVRVVVTTNFDRLLEQALADVGVQPTVISTLDAVQGALPLTHSTCTIIKVHGDYLDSRLKNTRPELAAYDRPLNDLLDRVFDEYGIIVCGWSAEWDVALRAAMERCATHRFGTYWAAHRGKVAGEAEKLIGLRRATVVPITDADSFFRELAEKITALEDFALTDPVSAKVAVTRMKRYLASPDQRINLYDLVNAETERVHAAINGARFNPDDRNISPEITLARLRAYEAETSVLLSMLACGGYRANKKQFEVLGSAITRLANDEGGRGGLVVWLSLRRYPGMLAFYAAGIAAVANRKYGLLKHIFGLQIRKDRHRPEELLLEPLSPLRVLERDGQLLPGRDREFTPLNNHVFEVMRGPLRDYLPDDLAYEQAFDWFEYLVGLVHCDLTATPEEIDAVKNDPAAGIWGPIGRFLWSQRSSDSSIQRRSRFEPGGAYPDAVTAILRAGFFGSSGGNLNYDRFLLIKRGFDVLVEHARRQKNVW
ncbi:MAG: SIR2 family protein [Bryobacterales bacterium]|nr:SIR2 family protein [Bryobacterales bacterium]